MVTQGTNKVNLVDFVTMSNGSGMMQSNAEGGLKFRDMLNKSTLSDYTNQKNGTVQLSKGKADLKTGKIAFETTKKVDSAKTQLKGDVTSAQSSKQGTTKVQDSSEQQAVQKLVNEIKSALKDTLDISEEELVQIMEILGLSMVDLLSQSGLQQILMNSAGCDDVLEFLSNEELTNTLQQLLATVDDMIGQSGMTKESLDGVLNSEDFEQLLNQNQTMESEGLPLDGNDDTKKTSRNDNERQEVKVSDTDETEKSTDNKINFSVERSNSEDDSDSFDSSEHKEFHKGEQKVTADQLLDHMVASTTSTEMDFSGELTTITTIRDIANQIVEEIKVVIRPGQTSMEMQLNPEHLGKVSLTVSSKEGVMTALFTTQTELAKEAIESQLQVLRQSLESQGINVDAIEVTVSSFSFEQSSGMNEKEESGSKKSKRAFRMDTEEENDSITQPFVLASGLVDENISNVDFSA